MMNQDQKEWWKAIGNALKALSRLTLSLIGLVTKFFGIAFIKLAEWCELLSDKLA